MTIVNNENPQPLGQTPSEDLNEVKNYNLFSKEFWAYSGERIIKTFAMTASGILSTTGVFVVANPETANIFAEIGWTYIASVAGLAALNSFLVALSNFKDITTLKRENNL